MFTVFAAPVAFDTELARIWAEPDVVFLAGQYELAPTTQAMHFQGYICLSRSVRARHVVLLIGNNAHVERREGSHDQAVEYVTKVETRWVPLNGEQQPIILDRRRPEGAAGVWDAILALVRSGASDHDIASAYPGHFARYCNGIASLRQVIAPARSKKPFVVWMYGPTGCGKSQLCHALSTNHTACWKAPDSWWATYRQQEVLILDEMSPEWMPFRTLLRILDRYPLISQVKGSHIQVNSPVILITAHAHVQAIYAIDKEETDECNRRCDMIVEFVPYVSAAHGRSYSLMSRKESSFNARVIRGEVRARVETAIANWSTVVDESVSEDWWMR